MLTFKEYFFCEAAINIQNIQYNPSNYPNFRIKIKNAGSQLILEILQNNNYKFAGDLMSDVFGDVSILKGYKLYNWHSDLPTNAGYGPLFYDIATEIATKNGGYLISSTFLNRLQNVANAKDNKGSIGGDTSDAAENIYKFYYYKRNDVEKIQPNIILNNEPDQANKPHMYELYRKNPTTLNQLIQINKNGKQPVLVNGINEPLINFNF